MPGMKNSHDIVTGNKMEDYVRPKVNWSRNDSIMRSLDNSTYVSQTSNLWDKKTPISIKPVKAEYCTGDATGMTKFTNNKESMQTHSKTRPNANSNRLKKILRQNKNSKFEYQLKNDEPKGYDSMIDEFNKNNFLDYDDSDQDFSFNIYETSEYSSKSISDKYNYQTNEWTNNWTNLREVDSEDSKYEISSSSDWSIGRRSTASDFHFPLKNDRPVYSTRYLGNDKIKLSEVVKHDPKAVKKSSKGRRDKGKGKKRIPFEWVKLRGSTDGITKRFKWFNEKDINFKWSILANHIIDAQADDDYATDDDILQRSVNKVTEDITMAISKHLRGYPLINQRSSNY